MRGEQAVKIGFRRDSRSPTILCQQSVSMLPSRCPARQGLALTRQCPQPAVMWCGAWCWRAARGGRTRFTRQAEVTGSIPVTPTSTNAIPNPQVDPCCQQICQQITDSGEASQVWASG
jgi:hypothetical protein